MIERVSFGWEKLETLLGEANIRDLWCDLEWTRWVLVAALAVAAVAAIA